VIPLPPITAAGHRYPRTTDADDSPNVDALTSSNRDALAHVYTVAHALGDDTAGRRDPQDG
jgi:hypothetical protein